MSTWKEGHLDTRESKPIRKRKRHGEVTQVACDECRRRRLRCNGNSPDPCEPCRQKECKCKYTPHKKLQKEDILDQMKLLEQENEQLKMQLEMVKRILESGDVVVRTMEDDGKGMVIAAQPCPQLSTSIEQPITSRPTRIADLCN